MKKWSIGFLVCAAVVQGCGGGAECGDGIVEGAETCDDGSGDGGDGCSATCSVELGYACPEGTMCDPVCGDGIVVEAEVCDPSSSLFTEYCSADCTMRIAECGDATIQPAHEACDDGNSSARDGCTASCQVAFGWDCDPTTATCDASDADPNLTFGALDGTELERFCTWMIGMLGGPGRTHRCGSLDFTVNSVAQCEASIPTAPGLSACTVADFEGWTAERSGPCDFLQSAVPIC